MEVKLTIDSSPIERPRPARIMTNKLEFIKKQVIPSLMKHPNGAPFSVPVNHKLLNIPDYPQVIKSPIDLSKIKTRLHTKFYYDSKECLYDIELMFNNCFLYNLPDSEVVIMGLALEKMYKDKIKTMPNDEYTIATCKRKGDGMGNKKSRNSGNMKSDISSVGSPQNSVTSAGRNQRRIDSSCYDMSPTPSPPRSNCGGKLKIKSDSDECVNKRPRLSDDLRLCGTILKEITSVRHRHLNEIFLEPVVQKFPNLVDYLEIIKNPMDLGTIRDNLENYRYKNKEEFADDIQLMFKNCYSYNGLESSVSQLARDLQKLFDETYSKAFKLNKPLIPIVHSTTIKPEPSVPVDTKSMLEAIQKELRHIVGMIVTLDNRIMKIAESEGEVYESALTTLPHMNGILKRPHGSTGKKRKAAFIDESGVVVPGSSGGSVTGGSHKRGRKSHHQKMQIMLQQQQQQLLTGENSNMATTLVNNIGNTNNGGAFYTASLISNNNNINTNNINHISNNTNAININSHNSLSTTPTTIVTGGSLNNGLYNHNQIQTSSALSAALSSPLTTTTQLQASAPLLSKSMPTMLNTIPTPSKSIDNNNSNNIINNNNHSQIYQQQHSQHNQHQQPPDTEDYTSYHARRNLSILIEKLSGKQLGRVIDILKENEAAYSNWNLDELDIDFEVLQAQTLKELYLYVKSIDPPITLEPQYDIAGAPVPAGSRAVVEPPEEGQISDSSSNSSESSSETSESDSESES